MSSTIVERQLQQEFEHLRNYFSNLPEVFSKVSEDIYIRLAETPSKTSEGLTEVKFSWWELPNLEESFQKFLTMKGKLKLLSEIFHVPGLDEYLKELQHFQEHFLEFLRPWEVLEWRCFYQRVKNQIKWYDNRKALIKDIQSRDKSETVSILEPYVQHRLRVEFQRQLQRTSHNLCLKANSLVEVISFKRILERLELKVTESLTTGIKTLWDEHITTPEPTQVQKIILAFLLRFSIEISVRNHFSYQISPSLRLPLGKVFGRLQNRGIFVKERPRIENRLDRLNEVIHGKNKKVTKSEISEIKDEFEKILNTQGIKLPI